jgi:hypothetical protein
MSDEVSTNYSYTASTVGAGNAPPVTDNSLLTSKLVAFADCELIGVDNQKMLVINRSNGKQQFFSPQVVEALKTCTTFDSIRNHTIRLCAARPELRGQEEIVSATLQQLLHSGFLLEAENIRDRLLDAEPLSLAPSRVFVITCDRPAAVERLLESMLRAGNLSRHDALYLIDDSRIAENRAANKELVDKFNLRSAKDMNYFGATEQRLLQDKLIAALPQHEAGIKFLIDQDTWAGHKTYGRSRTLSLLLSVGYRALVLDDDVLCQAIMPPVQEKGISFTGQREAAFYPDRDTLMAQGVPAEFDPLSGHLQCLGQSLGRSLQQLSSGEIEAKALQSANAAMLNVLEPSSPVLVTQCGAWGDPGTGSAHWTLHLNEASIERLVNATHGMVNAVENRCNWLGCPRPTLHKMAFMSQITGVDNSRLLPPYFPAFRGEDLLFGTMIESMYHHGAVLEYGWSVPHLPVDDRSGLSIKQAIAGEGGIVLFSRYMTENIDYKDASNPEQRLKNMAEDARRVAARSDEDLLLDYRTEQAKGQADSLFRLRVQAARAQELPSINWQSYLRRGVEEIEASIAEEHSPTQINGVPEGASEGELLAQFRTFALGWATAITAWTDIRNAVASGKIQ